MSDPFAPINRSAPKLRVVNGGGDDWDLVTPVPEKAPAVPKEHATLGAPSVSWLYLDPPGRLLGYVWRFDTEAGKEFRPWALWRSRKDGALKWRNQLWPSPRPLYGLDRLAARPSSPVVVCEGEKAADAARRLLPDHVCIASPGGSNAASKADWKPLAGRRVTVWRDADEPGAKYAAEVAKACKAVGALSVAIAEPPPGVSEGWDAADAEADGWTRERAEAFIATAAPIAARAKGESRKSDGDAETSPGRKARGSSAIIELVTGAEVEFWHDEAKVPYASFKTREHWENHRIASKEFARWVASLAYEGGVSPPSASALGDAILFFAARAFAEGCQRKPVRRAGEHGGKCYVDLGDDLWRVVEVGEGCWQILVVHRVPIVRSTAMLALPEPFETDQGIELLRGFVNADDDGFKLIVAWLLAALFPRGPYPILILNGEQGSAKSTLTKILRSLVDPNIAPLRTLPRDEMELAVAAQHSHVLAFDNISITAAFGAISDMLCRISTGGGVGARAKYSDADEVVLRMACPIILNGIPGLANRPDLASRAMVVRLQQIPEEARRTERQLDEEWRAVAPRVFAILLDVLAAARAALPNVTLAKASRMADFESLVEAAAPALGWERGEFGEIYRRNQSELDGDAMEADSVAGAIVEFMNDHPSGWAGSATRLHEALGTKVSETVRRSREWPASPISLGTRIERLKPVLRRNGISIERKHSGDRWIYLSAIPPPPPPPPSG